MWEGMFRTMTKLQAELANYLLVLVSSNIWCFILDKINVFVCAVPDCQMSPKI